MMPENALTLQNISPNKAHFALSIHAFLEKELSISLQSKSILIAFSGGPDSLALLLVLKLLQQKLSLSLSAAHVNHQLRYEANDEERHCKAICDTLHIPFYSLKAPVKELALNDHTGLEETGRNVRYAFFEELFKKHHYDWLATAHQLNDLAEDFIMRSIRGTGWPALAGMNAIDETRKIVRPLLLTEKKELVRFLADLPFAPVEDATNALDFCLRNRVRNRIIPLFVEENPNFLESVASLWGHARHDDSYFKQIINEHFPDLARIEPATRESIVLKYESLISLHKTIRLRIYKKALDLLGEGQALAATVKKLDEAWVQKKSGKTFQFPHAKSAIIQKGSIIFSKK